MQKMLIYFIIFIELSFCTNVYFKPGYVETTCASINGDAMCWGKGFTGLLGRDSVADIGLNPTDMPNLLPIDYNGAAHNVTDLLSVHPGGDFTCTVVVINGRNEAICFGNNLAFTLGTNLGSPCVGCSPGIRRFFFFFSLQKKKIRR